MTQLRTDLTPRWSADIHDWLTVATDYQSEARTRLYLWMDSLLDISQPGQGLLLWGEMRSGKSILMRGLARLFGLQGHELPFATGTFRPELVASINSLTVIGVGRRRVRQPEASRIHRFASETHYRRSLYHVHELEVCADRDKPRVRAGGDVGVPVATRVALVSLRVQHVPGFSPVRLHSAPKYASKPSKYFESWVERDEIARHVLAASEGIWR